MTWYTGSAKNADAESDVEGCWERGAKSKIRHSFALSSDDFGPLCGPP